MYKPTLVVATWLTGALSASSLTCQEVTLKLHNIAKYPRTQIVRGSVPFERGQVFDPTEYSVADKETAWRVLQNWPDGSIKIAQAQFEDTLGPGEWAERKVVRVRNPFATEFDAHPWILKALDRFRITSHVRDIDDVDYWCDPWNWEVLEQTAAVFTARARGYHYSGSARGIGRDFLTQTIYITVFRNSPVVYLDYVLGNDYLGTDQPVGNDPNLYPLADVAVNEAWLHIDNAYVAFRYDWENEIELHYDIFPGFTSARLLHSTYLADAQTKRWRAILMFDDHQAPEPERLKWLTTWGAEKEWPIIPIADVGSWQRTGAWGINGGPVDPPGDWQNRVLSQWNSWRNPRNFGPLNGWGDLLETWVGGTPRNGPASDPGTKAVQTGQIYPALELEAMAWQQALRPYHLWGLRVEPTTHIYMYYGLPYSITGGWPQSRETLGRLALVKSDPYVHWREGVPLNKNHGWMPYDTEHWSMDLIFDYHALTGDHWTLDEIRNIGECLMGVMRQTHYYSALVILAARSEGWCMQGFVQAYLATGDPRFKNAAIWRAHNIIDVQRNKNHGSKAIVFQDNQDKSPYPPPNKYYMPWQHAVVAYGYTAAGRFFEDPIFFEIAHDVVPAVQHAWVSNFQDPRWGFVANGLRYICPVEYQGQPIPANHFDWTPGIGVIWGDSPLGGAHTFLVSAMDLIHETTTDPKLQQDAKFIRSTIHSDAFTGSAWRWNKWMNLREPTR